MEYPQRLHEALTRVPGVRELVLTIRSLEGIDENALRLPGEFADLPQVALKRQRPAAEHETLVTAEMRFSQDHDGWVGVEFLSWFVRDLARGQVWVQMRSLALPPVVFGTQLGRTLKFAIEFFILDPERNGDPITDELNKVTDTLETALKTYEEALENPTQAYPPTLDALVACAERDDAQAQMWVAQAYAAGEGVEKSGREAFRWFERAAELGHPEAILHLGTCYASGLGTAVDQVKAAAEYRKAAEAGFPLAMGFLGKCYEDGAGVEKNDSEAASWYERGAARGELSCLAQLAECYEFGRGVTEDKQRALTYYKDAFEQGFEYVKPAIDRLENTD